MPPTGRPLVDAQAGSPSQMVLTHCFDDFEGDPGIRPKEVAISRSVDVDLSDHSSRNACDGSIRLARRAGK